MRAGFFQRLWRLATDDGGPTTAEYAMMLGLLLGAIILAIGGLGQATHESWRNTVGTINQAAGR